MRSRLRELFTTACVLAAPGALLGGIHGASAATPPTTASQGNAALFERKADSRGDPLPSRIEHFKLGADRTLKVMVKTPRGCTFGDLNAIALEKTVDTEGVAYVALENLHGEGGYKTPVTADVYQGKEPVLTLKVPKLMGPSVLGLFVCKAEDEDRCQDLLTLPIDVLIGQFDPRKKKPEGEDDITRSTKNYFFGHLLVDGDDVAVFPDTYSSLSLAALKQSLQEKKVTNFTQAVAFVNRTHRLLGSLPLQSKGGAVEIALPYLDPKTCTAEDGAKFNAAPPKQEGAPVAAKSQ